MKADTVRSYARRSSAGLTSRNARVAVGRSPPAEIPRGRHFFRSIGRRAHDRAGVVFAS